MTIEIKKWWERNSMYYQNKYMLPVEIHYGPGVLNEDKLKLLGKLKSKKVLELGCGGGQCSVAFAKKGAKVIGVDISQEQINFAQKLAEKYKVKINFIKSNFQNLKKIKLNKQDIVFSAFALHYVDDLEKCFREVFRVLKKRGIFVFSLDHPFYRTIDSNKLQVKESYLKTGKEVFTFSDPTKKFVCYTHTISDLFNLLIETGFNVEKIIEPDSRKRYSYDPWYGLWDYTPKMLKTFPP